MIWTLAIVACTSGALYLTVRRVRRYLRDRADADPGALTEAQRARWERQRDAHRERESAEAAERAAAERLMREQDEREGRA